MLRAAAAAGVPPDRVLDQTPAAAFAAWFRDPDADAAAADEADADPVERLRRWNADAAGRGVRPAVPAFLFPSVPRRRR